MKTLIHIGSLISFILGFFAWALLEVDLTAENSPEEKIIALLEEDEKNPQAPLRTAFSQIAQNQPMQATREDAVIAALPPLVRQEWKAIMAGDNHNLPSQSLLEVFQSLPEEDFSARLNVLRALPSSQLVPTETQPQFALRQLEIPTADEPRAEEIELLREAATRLAQLWDRPALLRLWPQLSSLHSSDTAQQTIREAFQVPETDSTAHEE